MPTTPQFPCCCLQTHSQSQQREGRVWIVARGRLNTVDLAVFHSPLHSFPKRQGITGPEENVNLSAVQFTKKFKSGFSVQFQFPFDSA